MVKEEKKQNTTKDELEIRLLRLETKYYDKSNKTIITYIGIISTIITLIISITTLYFNTQNNQKEIILKEKEVQIQQEKTKQSEIETQVKLINFVVENYDAFFEDAEKTGQIAGILLAAYPNEQTNKFFDEILKIIPEKNKEEIDNIRKIIDSQKNKIIISVTLTTDKNDVSIAGREVCIKGICDKTNSAGRVELVVNKSDIKFNSDVQISVDNDSYSYPITDTNIKLLIQK